MASCLSYVLTFWYLGLKTAGASSPRRYRGTGSGYSQAIGVLNLAPTSACIAVSRLVLPTGLLRNL